MSESSDIVVERSDISLEIPPPGASSPTPRMSHNSAADDVLMLYPSIVIPTPTLESDIIASGCFRIGGTLWELPRISSFIESAEGYSGFMARFFKAFQAIYPWVNVDYQRINDDTISQWIRKTNDIAVMLNYSPGESYIFRHTVGS